MRGLAQVLLVIPEALLRRELAALLRNSRYDVIMCRGATEGIRLAVERQPDLIITVGDFTSQQSKDSFAALSAATPAPLLCILVDTARDASAIEPAREARALGAADVVHAKMRPGVAVDLGPILLRKLTSLQLPSARAASRAPQASEQPRRPFADGGKVAPHGSTRSKPSSENRASSTLNRFPIFLIGCSTGGPNALETVISSLPQDFPAAVVVAQHMRADATLAFTKRLSKQVAVKVEEVRNTHIVEPGVCYIAAGGADIVFLRRQARFAVASVPLDPALQFHPSVDRMVRSAAQVVPRSRLRAALLTGIGQDGADSIAALHREGVPTIAESEDTCVVFGMPARLIDSGGAGQILPIDKIGEALQTMLTIKPRTGGPDRVHEARSKLALLAQRTGRHQ